MLLVLFSCPRLERDVGCFRDGSGRFCRQQQGRLQAVVDVHRVYSLSAAQRTECASVLPRGDDHVAVGLAGPSYSVDAGISDVDVGPAGRLIPRPSRDARDKSRLEICGALQILWYFCQLPPYRPERINTRQVIYVVLISRPFIVIVCLSLTCKSSERIKLFCNASDINAEVHHSDMFDRIGSILHLLYFVNSHCVIDCYCRYISFVLTLRCGGRQTLIRWRLCCATWWRCQQRFNVLFDRLCASPRVLIAKVLCRMFFFLFPVSVYFPVWLLYSKSVLCVPYHFYIALIFIIILQKPSSSG